MVEKKNPGFSIDGDIEVGRFPFQGDTRAVLFSAIRKNRFHVPDFISPASVVFITELLNPNDKDRPLHTGCSDAQL